MQTRAGLPVEDHGPAECVGVPNLIIDIRAFSREICKAVLGCLDFIQNPLRDLLLMFNLICSSSSDFKSLKDFLYCIQDIGKLRLRSDPSTS